MEISFSDRVKMACDAVGGPQQLAEQVGVSRRQIDNYIANRSDPSREVVVKMAIAAGFSVGWLASGQGRRHADDTEITRHAEQPRAGYVYLPLKEVEAAAGGGSLINGERVIDVLAFKEDWIRRELHAKPADLDLIYVKGKSMEPDLRPGDIILLDHTDTQASSEGVYVCHMDGAVIVKLLQRLPGAVIKVVSKNPDFETFSVILAEEAKKPDGFRVIGRVVWACRRF